MTGPQMLAEIAGGGAALLTRMIATAGFVLLMGWLVATARPWVAAAAIGLPVVVGPGFLVLALERPAAFVAASAWAGLGSLAGTAAFSAAVAVLAARRRSAVALAGGLAAWAVAAAAALALSAAAPGGPGAAVAFAAAWIALAARPAPPVVQATAPRLWRPRAEVLRAAAAGLTVGVVTLAAGRLGPQLSGAMLAIPVGMIFLAQGLLARGDPAVTAAVMRDAVRGVLALGAFMAAAALAAPVIGGPAAVLAAAATACAVAAAIGRARRRGDPAKGAGPGRAA